MMINFRICLFRMRSRSLLIICNDWTNGRIKGREFAEANQTEPTFANNRRSLDWAPWILQKMRFVQKTTFFSISLKDDTKKVIQSIFGYFTLEECFFYL